jgi:hypothetical protein
VASSKKFAYNKNLDCLAKKFGGKGKIILPINSRLSHIKNGRNFRDPITKKKKN